jgi:hypothetical protein
MPAPTDPTALNTAYRCIEHQLNQITHANNYRRNGLVVGRSRDVRKLREDQSDEYEDKLAAASILHVARVRDTTASISGRIRWIVTFNIVCLVTLSVEEDEAADEPGSTLAEQDKIVEETATDIEDDLMRSLRSLNFVTTSTALGLPRPTVIGLQVDSFLHGAPLAWPDHRFVANCSFLLDERDGQVP